MYPKMFEGYDEKLVKKDELISDIKENSKVVKSYETVYSDLTSNIHNINKSDMLDEVNNAKLNKYNRLYNYINIYIKEYVLQEISNKIISELGLNSGDMDKHNENKITEVLSEFIKDNI